jgi:hypothetical protein
MRVVLDGVEVRAGHSVPEGCETTIENAGGCVVALGTAFPLRGIVLNSCYLADLPSAPLAVSHLLTAPGQPPSIWQRLAGEELAGTSLERACLLDHAAILLGCLERLWAEPVRVTVDPRALDRAAGVWAAVDR